MTVSPVPREAGSVAASFRWGASRALGGPLLEK